VYYVSMTEEKSNHSNKKTDEKLVRETLENRDAFVHLIDRYEIKLYHYIRRITNVSPEEAEDILQEIFLKTFRNLTDFDTDLKFSSWIYRIAHNQVVSSFRKKRIRAENFSVELSEEMIETLASKLDLEKEMDLKLLKQKLDNVLGKLKKKHREVLFLRFLEEKSYKEISDIIMKPQGTVATLIKEAKQECLKEFQKNNLNMRYDQA